MATLHRHVTGDWGELCAEDKLANDCAVVEGMRILSAYRAANDTKFWIVTEHDRRTTTILIFISRLTWICSWTWLTLLLRKGLLFLSLCGGSSRFLHTRPASV